MDKRSKKNFTSILCNWYLTDVVPSFVFLQRTTAVGYNYLLRPPLMLHLMTTASYFARRGDGYNSFVSVWLKSSGCPQKKAQCSLTDKTKRIAEDGKEKFMQQQERTKTVTKIWWTQNSSPNGESGYWHGMEVHIGKSPAWADLLLKLYR